jgi:phosphotransacetylase
MSRPVHVVTPGVTARGILNVTALAALEAGAEPGEAASRVRLAAAE